LLLLRLRLLLLLRANRRETKQQARPDGEQYPHRRPPGMQDGIPDG